MFVIYHHSSVESSWDVAPCSHVEVGRSFRGAYCVHHHRPDDGGSTDL
jgi:hypothetical protein